MYEEKNVPGKVYLEHTHQDKVTVFVTEGSLELTIVGAVHYLKAGERLVIPPSVPYSAVAGPQGCQYVIGEMLAGDWQA